MDLEELTQIETECNEEYDDDNYNPNDDDEIEQDDDDEGMCL